LSYPVFLDNGIEYILITITDNLQQDTDSGPSDEEAFEPVLQTFNTPHEELTVRLAYPDMLS
jgi:hypothetical protein